MRVLHLTRTTVEDTTGGLEHHIAYLTEALRERGHDVEIVRMRSLRQDKEGRPFTKMRIGSRIPALLTLVMKFLDRFFNSSNTWSTTRRVNQLRPQIVHQHSYIGAVLTSLILSRKYPVVFTNHTGAYIYLNRWPATRWFQNRLMTLFSAVIAPSRELLPETPNSHYIPNGVDTRVFFPVPIGERRRLRQKWGCGKKLVFLCPRRWAPTKGIIYYVKTLAYLSPETRAKSIFLFAGNVTAGYEQYQQSVRDMLPPPDVCDVRVLGNVNHAELAELMNVADVCVIPSLMEATSLACLEAMACGTAVLGSATGGLLELIQDGKNGWLIPPGDVHAIHTALEKIAATNPEEIEPMRAAALELVRESYTWELVAAKTERIYRMAMECRSCERPPAQERVAA